MNGRPKLLPLIAVVALAAALQHPASARAAGAVDVFGPWADLGLAMRMQVLEVRGVGGASGELRELRFVPVLTVGTPTLTFGDTNFGCTLIWNFTSFDLNRQWTGESWKPRDYGTSASGFASYLVPTLTYTKQTEGSPTWTRIGVGAGLGYVRAKGTALLNLSRGEQGTEPVEDPAVRSFDVQKQTWAVSFLAEWHREPFTLALTVAGPGLLNGEDVGYVDFGVALSYSWYRAKHGPPAAGESPSP